MARTGASDGARNCATNCGVSRGELQTLKMVLCAAKTASAGVLPASATHIEDRNLKSVLRPPLGEGGRPSPGVTLFASYPALRYGTIANADKVTVSGSRSLRHAMVPSGHTFLKQGWQSRLNETVRHLLPYGPLRSTGVLPCTASTGA